MSHPQPTPAQVHLACQNPDLTDLSHTLIAAAGLTTTTATPNAAPAACLITDPDTLEHQPPHSPGTNPTLRPHPTNQLHIHVTAHPPTTTDWQRAVSHGAAAVLALPDQADQLLELLSALTHPHPTPAQHIAVQSLATGSGGTTFTALLAHAHQRHQNTIVIDQDHHCAHLSHHMGLPSLANYSWTDLLTANHTTDLTAIPDVLPQCGNVKILGWTAPPPHPISNQTCTDVITALRHSATVISDLGVTRQHHPNTTTLAVIHNTDQAIFEAQHRGPLTPQNPARLIIREHPTGTWSPAHVAAHLGIPHYHRWPHDRTLRHNPAGHQNPGNRATQKLITTTLHEITP